MNVNLSVVDAAYALARTGRCDGFKQLKARMIDDGWVDGLGRLDAIWADLHRECRVSKSTKLAEIARSTHPEEFPRPRTGTRYIKPLDREGMAKL